MRAIAINTKSEISEHHFERGESYDLLSDSVGGMIECVSLSDKIDMWINEEGKVYNFDLNPLATAIWEHKYGKTDIIVGDVILTGGVDEEGETLGLSDDIFEKLWTVFSRAKEELFV
jgi:hypothetical protein